MDIYLGDVVNTLASYSRQLAIEVCLGETGTRLYENALRMSRGRQKTQQKNDYGSHCSCSLWYPRLRFSYRSGLAAFLLGRASDEAKTVPSRRYGESLRELLRFAGEGVGR
jgi:hypothetical protein